MLTQTQQISTEDARRTSYAELSALYDRIYDIADRLIKKHSPCNIHKKGNKVTCIGKTDPSKTLCCFECSPLCGLSSPNYWDNGCTVKCLGCKLFLCYPARRESPILSKKLYRLKDRAQMLGLPSTKYYLPKEKWLKQMEKATHEIL